MPSASNHIAEMAAELRQPPATRLAMRRARRAIRRAQSRNNTTRHASNRIKRGMQARAAAANGRHYDPGKMRYNFQTQKNEYAGFDKVAYNIYKKARG